MGGKRENKFSFAKFPDKPAILEGIFSVLSVIILPIWACQNKYYFIFTGYVFLILPTLFWFYLNMKYTEKPEQRSAIDKLNFTFRRIIFPLLFALFFIFIWNIIHTYQDIPNPDIGDLEYTFFVDLFFLILATIYAICAAFLLWKGLSDFDELRHALRKEADEIQNIVMLLSYFEEGDVSNTTNSSNLKFIYNIKKEFIKYIDNVWQADKVQVSTENDDVIVNISDNLRNIVVKSRDSNDHIALTELIKSMSELVLLRSHRASCMEGKIPYPLMGFMLFMAVCIILPFLLVDPSLGNSDPYIGGMIMLMATFFGFIYATLRDLASPFDGYYEIKSGSFDKIRRTLKADVRLYKTRKI